MGTSSLKIWLDKNSCVLCAFAENTTGSPTGASEPAVTAGIDYDHDDFEDDSTSADTSAPVLYAVYGAAAVLGSVGLAYGCKVCLQRNHRCQQACHFATIALPFQFPNNIPRVQFVNQE